MSAKLALKAAKQLVIWMSACRLVANVRRVAEPWREKSNSNYPDYDFIYSKFVVVLLTS